MPSDVKPILLVDSDTKSRRVLEVSLRKAGYDVVGSDSAARALAVLEERPFGLVIFDTTLKDQDGYDFCAQAKSIEGLGQIPFIALSQSHDMANKLRGFELGVDDYIAKPVYLKEVVSRAKLLLERRGKEQIVEAEGEQVSGDLADFSVVDILQTLEEGQKTGALRLERGNERITIFFDNGRPVDANSGSVDAEEAVYRAISWDDGDYAIKYLPAVRRPKTINGTFNDLVVEGLQRSEQMEQIVKDLGSFNTVMKVDYSRISEMTDNMPPEVDEIVGLIDGRRHVGAVVIDSSLGDLESMQVIKRLSDTGVLTPVGALEDDDDEFEKLSWDDTEEPAAKADLVTWLTGDFDAVFPSPKLGAKRQLEQRKRRALADKAAQEALRLENERLAKEEAERKAREEAERKAREEAERKAREEAERKAREEEERLRKELNELFELKKSEEETLRRAEEEHRAAELRAQELEEREQQIVRRLTGEHATVPRLPKSAPDVIDEAVDHAVAAALAEARTPDPEEEDRVAALEEQRIAALEEERAAALEEERRLAIESAKAAERALLDESAEQVDPGETQPAVKPLQAPVSPVLGPSGTIRVSIPDDTPPAPEPEPEPAPEPVRQAATPPPIPEEEKPEAAADDDYEDEQPDEDVEEATAEPDTEEDEEGDGDDFDGFFKRDDSDIFSALYPEGQETASSSNRKPLIIASIITVLLAVLLIVTFNKNGSDTTTPTDEPQDEMVADDEADEADEATTDEATTDEAVAEPAAPTEEQLAAARLDAVQSGANFVELALRQSEMEAATFGSDEDLAAFELVDDGSEEPELDEVVQVVTTEDDDDEDDRRRSRDEEEEDDDRRARADDDDEEDDAPDVSRDLDRGRRHYERGNYGEATASLRQVIEADPRNAEALDLLGRSLYENGETREAVQVLERATRADRRNAELLLWLGSAKVDSGDAAGARESFERFLELSPDGDQADEVRRILEEL